MMSRGVFLKTRSSELSRKGFSQSCFQSVILAAAGYMAKFMLPMFSEHISGSAAFGAARRSSSVITALPPVVRFRTASVACLMRGRKAMKCAGSAEGRPVCGSRACRCRMAAPASAAPMACSAISSAVTGRWGDIDGVWIEPVIAQLMTILDISHHLSEGRHFGRELAQRAVEAVLDLVEMGLGHDQRRADHDMVALEAVAGAP